MSTHLGDMENKIFEMLVTQIWQTSVQGDLPIAAFAMIIL